MEGEAEQAPLAAAGDLAGEVEEGGGEQLAVADDADPPRLLEHEEPPRAVAGMGHPDREVEAADHRLEGDGDALQGCCRRV